MISRHNPLSTRFRVGKRFMCTLTFADGEMRADWSPMPRRLKQKEWADYRRGRDALLAEVAKSIGGNVLTVEPGPHGTRFSVARPEDAERVGGCA
jgi:hypothetical protein